MNRTAAMMSVLRIGATGAFIVAMTVWLGIARATSDGERDGVAAAGERVAATTTERTPLRRLDADFDAQRVMTQELDAPDQDAEEAHAQDPEAPAPDAQPSDAPREAAREPESTEPTAQTAPAPTPAPVVPLPTPKPARVDHVFIISVDGLRSDALIAPGTRLPNFSRLSRSGAYTLNARTDPDSTLTLPNHIGMITGRLMRGRSGHGWSGNSDPPAGATLHDNHDEPILSVFEVARSFGVATAAFASKTKFSLFEVSHDGLDEYAYAADAPAITDHALRALAAAERSLIFAHYRDPDSAGHASGWDLTPGSAYMESIVRVDAELGRLLDAIATDDRRRGRVAMIITTDHGGGSPHRSHTHPSMWVNYIIPFLVWIDGADRAGELYLLNALTRSDPGIRRPGATRTEGDPAPPIRNSDAANLALDLLGLPAVPGSVVNGGQELVVFDVTPAGGGGDDSGQ